MKTNYRFGLMGLLFFVLLFAPTTNMVRPVLAAPPANCADSSPVSLLYTVEVCITSPASGATFTGNGTITGTVGMVSGTNPGVEQMTFFLNSTYLLTTFTSPYTFTLPTNRYVDGTYTLFAQALMRDGFTTTQASISITLTTGTSSPPVNNNTFTPTSGRPAGGQPFVVAAVGDGASGEPNTTTVTNLIASVNPNLFLYLGDVYEEGSIAEFYNWYGNSGSFFDQFHSITDPTIGHHEYLTGDASAYFYYWDNVPNYYSFEANGWHIISLNSSGVNIGGIGPASPEYKWLQADLAANTSPCTIAFYHNPLYSIGNEAPQTTMVDIWKLLAQNKVDIVLNGNDHDYERWMPMDANGTFSLTGMTEFILGTGGHALEPIPNSDPRVVYWNNTYPTAIGVLFLTLNPTYANFSFRSAVNGAVLDSGSIPCVDSSLPMHYYYLPVLQR
jgi:hypothetical protein